MDAVEIPENQSGSQFSERDAAQIAEELKLTSQQIQNVIALLDEGNTVPFITRYRKERTGNLDEVQIRDIQKRVQLKRQLRERATTILRLIEAQQQLTPELKAESKRPIRSNVWKTFTAHIVPSAPPVPRPPVSMASNHWRMRSGLAMQR